MAGAAIGGLLAIPFVSPPGVTVLIIAAVGVAAGAVIAPLFVRPRPDAPPPDRAPQTVAVPVLPAETVRAVLPVNGQWWAKTAPARPAAAAAVTRHAAPDLAGYVDAARVVQCPACGEFRIDVTHVPGGFAFRCRGDDHRWEWQAGMPWPATVNVSRPVRRN
jgi:hypothetical protein